jgi:hypothetical protein
LAAVAAILAAVAVAAVLWMSWSAAKRPPAAAEISRRQITANPEQDPVMGPALSPDGQYLAYSDLTGVHLKLIATGETRSLPFPPGFCFR